MILCIDIGNTHITGGVYDNNQLRCQFQFSSKTPVTSDQLGVFFKSVLHENSIDEALIKKVAISSVVPALQATLRTAFLNYFSLEPFFLQASQVKNLKIGYKNPQEVGADRICSALAALHQFPEKNLIVIDMGTATTIDVITKDKEYLGGLIMPGVYISMKSLHENTAKLSLVEIIKPENIIGQTTASNVQAGIYYSHLGALREMIARITDAYFKKEPPLVIATGGFAHLFSEENIFTEIVPGLVLKGLYLAVTS